MTLTRVEVAQAAQRQRRALVVVDNRVYDLTDFVLVHPGGRGVILEAIGRDASLAFHGAAHSAAAARVLAQYAIGDVAREDAVTPGKKR